jgi:hypothetical protein
MSTPHNAQSECLGKRQPHGLLMRSVLVRMSKTKHNLHYRTEQGTGTDVLLGRGSGIVPIWLIRYHVTQRPVEPPAGRAQPFYPDVSRPPTLLELVTVPAIDWSVQVERATIPEVQPRPSHHQIVRSRCNA